MTNISLFKNIKQVTGGDTYLLDQVLQDIKSGKWQDLCLKIASEKDKEKRQELKKKVPYFTPSGTFDHRKSSGLTNHSGLIAIDFDEVDDINYYFNLLEKDPYTYALFRSISGRGLCCIVKIDPEKHLESFLGIQSYYWSIIKLPIDQACKDVCRARYISYDPDLFQNVSSKLFKSYPKKESKQDNYNRTYVNYLHTSSKFERVLSTIDRDITGDYQQWLQIGYAIASEYGTSGEAYYQQVSSYSSSYNQEVCSRQYKACCKAPDGGKKAITISSFYYYVKQSGIEITSDREEYVSKIAYYAKEGGRGKESVSEILSVSGITAQGEDQEVIDKVFSSENFRPIEEGKGKKLDIDDVQLWLKTNYNIKRNLLTRAYEHDNKELETEDLNSIFLQGKKLFDKLSRDIFDTILFSNFTHFYNPVMDFFNSLSWDGVDRIEPLSRAIHSETGSLEWRKSMLTKWLVGIIESIYTGDPNILCLVLAGRGNTGKTQFFKRLLPPELKPYFANSQMDKGKDDEILMTQKLIVFDDEYSGKSKQDSKKMKMLLSADSFTLREPYGKKNVTLRRIATFCGTCNEIEVLNDSTGNRRILVFEATGTFDFDLYNSVSKNQLFAQIKHLFDLGERAILSNSEIAQLDQYTTGKYSESCIEGELISKFFEDPHNYVSSEWDFKTTSEVKDYIETHTKQKLSIKKLGMELRRLGYERCKKQKLWGYFIADKNRVQYNSISEAPPF